MRGKGKTLKFFVVISVILCFLLLILSKLYQIEASNEADNNSNEVNKAVIPVSVSVNKVWPFHNPVETYAYYDALRACEPPKLEFERMSFGQIMRGDRLVNSLYKLNFMVPVHYAVVCQRNITVEDILYLQRCIDNFYMFEIFVDDLPLVDRVGVYAEVENGNQSKYLLATHFNFSIGVNNNKIVAVNLTTNDRMTELPIKPTEDLSVVYTYSVYWDKSDIPVHMRFKTQFSGSFTTSNNELFNIRWLAITNSFLLVMLVLSMLFVILVKVVRSDLTKYLQFSEDEIFGGDDEAGWKLIHGDVFRPPVHRMWFSACVGSGAHLCFVTAIVIIVGCFSSFLQRGTLISAFFVAYLLTSFVAGYISANLYRRLGGLQWKSNNCVTILMFVVIFFPIWIVLNSVASSYKSTAAIPFSVFSTIFFSWLFITFPLTIIGAYVGRKHANKRLEVRSPFSCKTNKLPREIPTLRWKESPWLHIILSGFFPFTAMYIELHYVFLSVWSTRTYTFYGILLFSLGMLLLSAAATSVILTYKHLSCEDYRWWWRAFVSGGSIAFYFYLYCIYYFFMSTRVFGVLQTAFFLGYCLVFAWGLFLSLGFVTFAASYVFVTYIFSRIKVD